MLRNHLREQRVLRISLGAGRETAETLVFSTVDGGLLYFIERTEGSSAAQVHIGEVPVLRNIEGDCCERIDHLLEGRRTHRSGVVSNLDRGVDEAQDAAHAADSNPQRGKFPKYILHVQFR